MRESIRDCVGATTERGPARDIIPQCSAYLHVTLKLSNITTTVLSALMVTC